MTASDRTRQEKRGPSRFWAIVRYELLWNLRKKKILVVLLVAALLEVLLLALTPALLNIIGEAVTQNPDYVVSTSIPGYITFFFGMVIVMNSISGEFESGTVVPLLAKPVSRTTVFLGKLAAALLTLIPAYVLLFVIQVVGGSVVYGPQGHLYLVPLTIAGAVASTLVWMAIVLAIGSATKSSVLAAVVSVAIYFGLSFASGIISGFQGQSWVLTYLPGGGNTGYLIPTATASPSLSSISVSTGPDGIASALTTFVLYPSYYVAFAMLNISSIGSSGSLTSPTLTVISTQPLWYVLLTAVGVALGYIVVFLLIAWFALRRTQISE